MFLQHHLEFQFYTEHSGIFRVPVKCETKYTETKLNSPKRNEINAKRNKSKRNGIIQNEIKPILTKQFLGERQDKNLMEKK
jgi:hypothetical protein